MALAAVGSTNPVKHEAALRALGRVWPEAQLLAVDADSGVSVQPTSAEEAVAGAVARARAALALTGADLGLGIEGNTEETPFGMASTAWVAAVHRDGRVGLGSSGRFLLPDAVAEAVRAGGELGPVMDLLVSEENIKHKQGAVGVFTAGRITRADALSEAVILALCPFLAPEHY